MADGAAVEAVIEAWNTPPWSCNLERAQQVIMARIAVHAVRDYEVVLRPDDYSAPGVGVANGGRDGD